MEQRRSERQRATGPGEREALAAIIAFRGTRHDDRTSTDEEWPNGVRTFTIQRDHLDAKDWQEIIPLYDSEGQVERRSTLFDDAILADAIYLPSADRGTTMANHPDAHDWSVTWFQFSVDGVYVLRAVQDDDRDILFNAVVNDELRLSVLEDLSDSQPWYARARQYDETTGELETLYFDTYEDLQAAQAASAHSQTYSERDGGSRMC